MGRGRRERFGFGWKAWVADAFGYLLAGLAWLFLIGGVVMLGVIGWLGVRWALDERTARSDAAVEQAAAALPRSGDEIAQQLGCTFERTVRQPGEIVLDFGIDTLDEGTCAVADRTLTITLFREKRDRDGAVGLASGALCDFAKQFGAAGPFYGAQGRWWLVGIQTTPEALARDDHQIMQSVASILDGSLVTMCANG